MAQAQIADAAVPVEFTAYQVENSMVNTALYRSGVAALNAEKDAQLQASAESSAVPFWSDLPDREQARATFPPLPQFASEKITLIVVSISVGSLLSWYGL